MTQADGAVPTLPELRGVLGRARIESAAYTAALTRACATWDKVPPMQRWAILAEVSAAHAVLAQNLADVYVVLGLPYDPVIEVEAV